jgi:hypothetical protein
MTHDPDHAAVILPSVTTPDPFHIPQALREYFHAIEAAVAQERGQPLILSPQDFVRVFEWWDREIPLEAVLAGLAEFFARKKKRPGRKIYTLAYADDEVTRAYGDLRRRSLGAALGVPVDEAAEVKARLLTLAEKLRAPAADRPAPLQGLCNETAAQLEELARQDPPPALVAVSKLLTKKDQELLAVAGSQLDEAEKGRLRTEVATQLNELAIALTDDAMRELLHARRLRELRGLPRLGMYG